MQVCRGHHVLCQALRYFCLQGIGCYLAVGSIVGTEVLLAVQFANHDDRLPNAFHLQHDVLNLAQFYAQSAQFNLMVGAPEDDDIAVREPLGIVTRLIYALPVVFHETLTGHPVEVVVATCHAATADVQLAHHAYGQFVAVAIDDKLLDIQLWLADGHQLGIRQLGIVRCHGDLRRSVAVEDAGLGHAAH